MPKVKSVTKVTKLHTRGLARVRGAVNSRKAADENSQKGKQSSGGADSKVQKILKALEDEFSANRNDEQAVQMKRYLRDQFEFFGIRAPILRPVCKKVLASFPTLKLEECHSLMLAAWTKPEREFQTFATDFAQNNIKLLMGTSVKDCELSLDTTKKLITSKSWWDTVDMLASNVVGPLVAKHPLKLKPVLDEWIEHDDLWLRRTAILYQLKYKEATDSDTLFRYCVMRSDEEDFFIRKAIGWALRNYAYTNAAAVKSFVKKQKNLSPLSVKEALKHIGS